MMRTRLFTLLLSHLAATAAVAAPEGASCSLIPWPRKIELKEGQLRLGSARIVASAPALLPLAEILADEIAATTRLKLPAVSGPAKAGDIVLTPDPSLKDEAYRLSIGTQAVVTGGNYGAIAMGTVSQRAIGMDFLEVLFGCQSTLKINQTCSNHFRHDINDARTTNPNRLCVVYGFDKYFILFHLNLFDGTGCSAHTVANRGPLKSRAGCGRTSHCDSVPRKDDFSVGSNVQKQG